MKKSLFIILASVITALSSFADITADWKIHMPYDQWNTDIIETPSRVYFTGRTFEYKENVPSRAIESNSLFYYDKAGDEIISINARNIGTGNAVACIEYNLSGKFLLVVYTDCNIDYIYDDGRVFNVPALKATSVPGKKEAISISFDVTRNRSYVATTFGYICLNDTKHEIAESRNYGQPVTFITRCGNNIVLSTEGELMYAPASAQRFGLADYSKIDGAPKTDVILSLIGDDFVGFSKQEDATIDLYTKTASGFSCSRMADDPKIWGWQHITTGYRITGNANFYELKYTGDLSSWIRNNKEQKKPAATLNNSTVWVLEQRQGLRNYRASDWAVKHDYMRPNAPATYICTSLTYHPTYGMLAGSNGVDVALNDFNQSTACNISALKNGLWTEYGPSYVSPMRLSSQTNYQGVAVDPQNSNYIYRGSTLGGLMRLNLAKPDDIFVLANPSNRNNGKEAFVQVADDQPWTSLCRFTTPQFTSDGTMWTLYNNNGAGRAELWYWPAADRAAFTSAATYRPMKKIPMPEAFPNSNNDVMITLSKNKNIVVVGGVNDGGYLLIYDHNGTPATTGDDRYVMMTTPYDQDGGGVSFLRINNLVEDPETGMVWIMSERGLYTINPATAFDNPNTVNRIKVSRNDGTNLADYLLNEINVLHMSIDGEGRKWFATSSGLVCTSRDGRTILGEFTSDNSYLPEGNVYATAYNPESGSLMVATDGGLVEAFPSGSGNSAVNGQDGFRVFPNPVEPDYFGWVRMDNIADGSLVKITDSNGGIVKELGPVEGGSIEWDISGYHNRRVSTGVYYIMVSPGSSSGGKTQIQKILVLN